MATLFKNYSIEKLQGKIYTPEFIVEKILDEVGYKGKQLLGKKILDPACGDGAFLIGIVKRIIQSSPREDIEHNLSYVFGWDIDKDAINACIDKLNFLVKDLYIKVEWNVVCSDTLKKVEAFNSLFHSKDNVNNFDFIVGNPPYIRIQHLHKDERNLIQKYYNFCKSGSTDIFIAFFEFALAVLGKNGVCGLITPNTFLTTQTAYKFRKSFEEKQSLLKLINYGHIQLFENATTYSAITIFNNKKKDFFIYEKALSKNEFQTRKISFEEIKGKKFWQLSTNCVTSKKGKRLKDICKIHCGLATLADKVYIFQVKNIDDEYILAKTKYKGEVKIERAVLKPIVKASILKSSEDPIVEYILFPYKKVDGKHKIIPEEQLQKEFPLAHRYLLSVKEILDKRCNGEKNPVAWYGFGRTQALNTSFGERILFSPMAKKPNFIYYGNKEATFYSGYCIKYDGDYQELLDKLNSKEMEEYIAICGRDFRHGWKSYSKKIVEEFIITNE